MESLAGTGGSEPANGVLVECMGLGRDGILKLKVEKFEALREWNLKQDTGLFVWNSSKGEYAYIKMAQLIKLIWADDAIVAEVRSFNDGNEYYPIKWADVEDKVVVS